MSLTVTIYLIFQGLAPMFIGTFSDDSGRRPAYIVCFTIYLFANLGLAPQESYPALLILRMLQSAGSSGTVALATAVVADIVTSAERGLYIGLTAVPIILGPSLSPVLGGLFSQYAGWRWIFWFSLILSAAFFIPFLLLFPETCRHIVGNGSHPAPPLNRTLLDILRPSTTAKPPLPRRPLLFPNPLRPLALLTSLPSFIILLSTGLLTCALRALSITLPHAFATRYAYTDLQISLLYLPLALGSLLSALTRGLAMDRAYACHAAKIGLEVQKGVQHDLAHFPIERARLEPALPVCVLGAGGVVGFGWSVERGAHVSVPCVMLFVVGFGLTAGLSALGTLLVDGQPGRAGAAVAAGNLVRCLMGAGASAGMDGLVGRAGMGWTGVVFAAGWVVTVPLLGMLMVKGVEWRAGEAEQDGKKEKEEEVKRRGGEDCGGVIQG